MDGGECANTSLNIVVGRDPFELTKKNFEGDFCMKYKRENSDGRVRMQDLIPSDFLDRVDVMLLPRVMIIMENET
jgi:hypothetical protein